MTCPFCNLDNVRERLFLDHAGWVAFLAAPFHVAGHAILAKNRGDLPDCPRDFAACLDGLGDAMGLACRALEQHYRCDILVSSVRGDQQHVHFHLIRGKGQ